ncbi:putative membrane protein [Bradyrhizobium diazoefficiens]
MIISAEPIVPEQRPNNDRGYALAVYVLYALGFFTIITAVIGLIIAYVKASTAGDVWLSHFQFQIRTFWIGLLYFVAGFALLYFFIGAFIILWWTIWTLVRIIKGAILLHDQRPIAAPTSWLFG